MLFQSCSPARLSPHRCLALAAEVVRQLPAVVVADHVVGEDDEPLQGEVDRAPGHRRDRRVFEPAVRPVTVRRQNRGEGPGAGGSIQVAGDVEARQALEVDLGNRVAVAPLLVEDLRVKRCLVGHRQQARRRKNVLAKIRGSLLPLRGGVLRHAEAVVERAILRRRGQDSAGQEQKSRQVSHADHRVANRRPRHHGRPEDLQTPGQDTWP